MKCISKWWDNWRTTILNESNTYALQVSIYLVLAALYMQRLSDMISHVLSKQEEDAALVGAMKIEI